VYILEEVIAIYSNKYIFKKCVKVVKFSFGGGYLFFYFFSSHFYTRGALRSFIILRKKLPISK